MNKSIQTILGVLTMGFFVLAGCATSQPTVTKAVTPTQKAFYEVQALYEKGKFEKAVASGQNFLDQYPDHLFTEAVHYYMGSSAAKLGHQEEAKTHFQAIVQHNPSGNWAQLAKLNLEEMGVKDAATSSQPAAQVQSSEPAPSPVGMPSGDTATNPS